MEIIAVLILFVLTVMIYKLKGQVNSIDQKLDELKSQLENDPSSGNVDKPQKPPVDSRDIIAAIEDEINLKKPAPEKADDTEEKKPEAVEEPVAPEIVHKQSTPIAAASPIIKPTTPPRPPKPSFMERNPDLERFIGENLLSKIGIVIFVIGMGFLVKLGIDSGVITEGLRVAIGVLIGGAMIGLAHYLRHSFSKFSSILIGGALAVLYFTIALAFHEYGLLPQVAAFIIMVLITAFGVLLSVSYDRKSLAVLALIGGFGTPFFISTGSGDIVTLFAYILILDIGMLTLVYFKKWNIVNYLTYGFTYILFSGVYINNELNYITTANGELFLFLTAFYLIFFVMSIVYNVKNKRAFKWPEIGMLLSNSSIYFGFGIALTQGYKGGLYSGLFTGLVALFNFGFAYVLYKRKEIDKNLIYLLIGLVLTFLTLVAPIQLKGNFITLFWALESVLLLWLAQKSQIKLMNLASILISLLMTISLLIDWQQNYIMYSDSSMRMFLNKVFITSFISMGALFATLGLMKRQQDFVFPKTQLVWRPLYVKVLFILIVYGGFFLELDYQFIQFELAYTYRMILLGIYNFSFVLGLMIYQYFKPSDLQRKVIAGLSIAVVISYLTAYLHYISFARDLYISNQDATSTGYFAHYVLLVLFILILINLYREIYVEFGFKSKNGSIALWLLAFICLFVCSIEVGHISVLSQGNIGNTEEAIAYTHAVKHAYPIVWAISALALMILGMKFKLKTLRLASLVIFSITTIKLFFYDLAGNSTGKIISFILLGVILLLVSFLYQKLKFIIQDDEKKD